VCNGLAAPFPKLPRWEISDRKNQRIDDKNQQAMELIEARLLEICFNLQLVIHQYIISVVCLQVSLHPA
jgi:hypothetical protein